MTGDSQPGTAYAYTHDAAGRTATVSLNGVQQAEYQYSATGQQVVRRLVPSNVTLHNVFDSAGNRIAEYQVNTTTGVSTLIREYIWANGRVVGVFEGGKLYFVRSDHIGRPVSATRDTGVAVWTDSYLPFGGVRVTTGSPIALRFPGQWFQSKSALHQNWMRDYDPKTGRYLQSDPMGLVDGARSAKVDRPEGGVWDTRRYSGDHSRRSFRLSRNWMLARCIRRLNHWRDRWGSNAGSGHVSLRQ